MTILCTSMRRAVGEYGRAVGEYAKSRCIARRTQVIVSLLSMLKGVSGLSNGAVNVGNRASVCREEGSVACNALKV